MSRKSIKGQALAAEDKRLAERMALLAQMPQHVEIDSRIAIAVFYYATEEDAIKAGSIVQQLGETYNGGMFDGMPCGREPARDYTHKPTGQRRYAVTR